MTQLAFDFGEPEWEPIVRPFGMMLESVAAPIVCRDCGGKAGGEVGGANRAGIYYLCRDCAHLDGCGTRVSATGAHVSHWGDCHPAEDHERLVAGRGKRRAAYARRLALAGGKENEE